MNWGSSGSRVELGADPGSVHRAVRDRLVDVQVPVWDLEVEPAIGVRAGPGLEVDGRALAAEVREGHKVAHVALLALGKIHRHDHFTPPALSFWTRSIAER